ncbi:DUF2189 domain-containing protein [Roseovarius gahaiensis]|uniref:DUF2189 domain-containing protein n=1 Tax=Roseovarius gahaiensis TaxID=2716691 RepID=A0A967BFC5_9RHOB|nr:DUF2189 domain-containing protein [Roseovarius gahaiensis]NHQ73528.1 DUF2189 domain-containing protein [Roseovarius gahaiensis]
MEIEESKPLGAPELGPVTFDMLKQALRLGWADMKRAPGYALIFSGVYVAIGWFMVWVTWITGQSYWLIFAAVGFPLFGPFAAVGLYEVSHRLEQGLPLEPKAVFGVIAHQRRRQLPSICAVVVIMFLFWFFLAHMIFALFLGFSTMTNISSSYDVYLTQEGLMMLGVGSAVGAGFALLLYMITVVSLPLLLDREVDFVTAMISSFQTVLGSPAPMLVWAAFIALSTFVALIPGFLGLFLVLPLLGHATWHLYRQICKAGGTC